MLSSLATELSAMHLIQSSVLSAAILLAALTIAATDIVGTVVEDINIVKDGVIAVGEGIVYEAEKLVKGCECVKTACGCCDHLEEARIHLNSTVCVNVTYLSEDYGVSVTATINHYTIFNETVSARNPPPFCVGAPYVKEYAEMCLRFHDMDATRTSLHACVSAEARMKRILLAHYELGCFDIGKVAKVPTEENEIMRDNHFSPKVYLV